MQTGCAVWCNTQYHTTCLAGMTWSLPCWEAYTYLGTVYGVLRTVALARSMIVRVSTTYRGSRYSRGRPCSSAGTGHGQDRTGQDTGIVVTIVMQKNNVFRPCHFM
ncbi:hypothetical protein BO70DRAFT_163976 [Aspergillus heteromorphus CBS 117.55]|uniref:Uncharacterized protein n=1 Tax=Aspergillus heteromorphus CBS 117.55 TaxID=1448321 RepID=A0A317WSB2_9EURO|nr:uncharacterized protein BO70DRAFT_163976 [Aspergillus heteromorphus CBS 117.55]PWY89259.1 hypothetical protein BO70DRAFT_163976 [Aspergillus heteromorphus CBS 117.55]